MPEQSARRRQYDPYRNVTYAYDGSAVRVVEGREVPRPQPRPRKSARRQEQELTRPRVEVRPAGKVSPFAVAGFAAVAVLAVLILMSYVQLSAISHEMVSLSDQMTELRSEEATLRARYELAYDLGAIESAMTADGSMSRPQAGQLVYVSMAQPDKVVFYGREETNMGSFLEKAEEIVGNLLAYFRG